MRALLLAGLCAVCLAAGEQDIYSGPDITTLFTPDEKFEHGMFEMRRTNVEVAVKQYNYLLVGFCSEYSHPEDCSSSLRGVWPVLSHAARLIQEVANATKDHDAASIMDDVGVALVNTTRSRSIARLVGLKKLPAVYEFESFMEGPADEASTPTMKVRFRQLTTKGDGRHHTGAALLAHARNVLRRKRAAGFVKGNRHKMTAKIEWQEQPPAELPAGFGLQEAKKDSLKVDSESRASLLQGDALVLIAYDFKAWLDKNAFWNTAHFANELAKHLLLAADAADDAQDLTASPLPVYIIRRDIGSALPAPWDTMTSSPVVTLFHAASGELSVLKRRPTPSNILDFVNPLTKASASFKGLKLGTAEVPDIDFAQRADIVVGNDPDTPDDSFAV